MTYPSLLKVTAAETNVITETQTPPIFDEIEVQSRWFPEIFRETIYRITAKKFLSFRPASGIAELVPTL